MVTDALASALVVDPVPWARSQMAFTLAFHIILVPLGVSWAVMTLIANYRGIKHDDPDAMLLAQRWSKYMAVTFAVGAVTGTVLSFEFGLLWPRFMGQWGAAFGVPFAFEGIFFFTEAVFISIYIFGWRRLKPWTHFWTGVPIAVAGVFGSISVVAANAWMNSPQGVTLDSAGKVDRRRPDGGDLQQRDAADGGAHGGRGVPGRRVPDRLGLRRRACCAGRRDRYHRLGFIIAFTVAAIATPVQMGVGDGAGALGLQRPAGEVRRDRDGAEDQQRRPRGAASATSTPTARWSGASRSRVWPRSCPTRAPAPRPSSRASTRCPPTTGRPIHEVNVTHLAWDVMVGLGTLLFLLTLWWWASWIFRRDMPRSRWFLRAAAAAGVLGRGHPGGGLDGQRGRPAAMDRLREDEGRGRRHREHRDLDHLHRRGDPLPRARHHHDPGAAPDEPPVPRRATGPTRPTSPTVRTSRSDRGALTEDEQKVPLG